MLWPENKCSRIDVFFTRVLQQFHGTLTRTIRMTGCRKKPTAVKIFKWRGTFVLSRDIRPFWNWFWCVTDWTYKGLRTSAIHSRNYSCISIILTMHISIYTPEGRFMRQPITDRVTIVWGLRTLLWKTVQLFGTMQVASSTYPSSLTHAQYHSPYLSQRTGTLRN